MDNSKFKLLNEKTLNNLTEGTYAIFLNGVLTETIIVESDTDYIVGAIMGSDEIHTAQDFMKMKSNLDGIYTIIKAEEIHYGDSYDKISKESLKDTLIRFWKNDLYY